MKHDQKYHPLIAIGAMLNHFCEESDTSRQCRIIADGLRGKTDADYPGCTEAELAEKIREVKFRTGGN